MNTFGHADSRQFALIDPRSVRADRQRFRRESIVALERANSFYCPVGRWSSRGWLLLSRSDYDRLDKYATTLQLNIGDTGSPNNVGALKNLAIVQAQCVTRGLVSDPNAVYLVEITDARGILYNQWFQHPLTAAYNIRAPAYPGGFHTGSLSGGSTVWTWSTMLQDMWLYMPLLGAWPGLPVTPAGTPEGFWFSGVSAWYALNDVLEYLGMTVACDLTSANTPFTIVRSGATSNTLTTLQNKYLANLEDDLEWIDQGSGRVPATVKVLFRKRYDVYGTEETVRSDTLQWSTTPIYTVIGSAPAIFSSAVGTHFIWSDFTVRYNQDGVPYPADVTTATAIAAERITQYFGRIYNQTLGFMSQTYAGALPFATESDVDGVCWYCDYRGGEGGWNNWAGWRTQIVRGNDPPWRGLWDSV